ncbi:MAG: beta-mannosidase [Clostridiales bacterium]|nr:beta-mannosidase [Clostridiales bacterium]
MRVKKIISTLIALSLCVSIAGCAKGGKSSSGDSSDNSSKNTVPVVESIGDLDLSDYIIKTDVDPSFKIEFEGEAGELKGAAEVLDLSFLGEFSGTGFAMSPDANSPINYQIEIPADGSYDINLVVAGDTDKGNGSIQVDGSVLSTFNVNSSKLKEEVVEKLFLTKGTHTLGIIKGTTTVYIDTLEIVPSKELDLSQYEVSNVLANPNANDTTKRLYNFLTDVYGKYIISGNYISENTGRGVESREFKQLKNELGDYPAIMGLDLIDLTPSRVEHGTSSSVVLGALEWDKMGGIVSLCWHWNAPEDYLEVNGKSWDKGFYSEATNFDLKAALDKTDQKGYDCLIRDIDAIADALKELESYDVPILWRPLHEAGGDPVWNNPWFWWGSSGSEAYMELWKLMYDRLTNHHGINNLIWVWNAQNVGWYPGDEYVDIIGFDLYPDEHDASSQKETYDYIKASTGTNKIIALTENGAIPDPDICMADGARWAWFSVWNGEFTLKDSQISSQYTEMDLWKKVYTHDRVLTFSELPDLKSYPLDTEAFLASQK